MVLGWRATGSAGQATILIPSNSSFLRLAPKQGGEFGSPCIRECGKEIWAVGRVGLECGGNADVCSGCFVWNAHIQHQGETRSVC